MDGRETNRAHRPRIATIKTVHRSPQFLSRNFFSLAKKIAASSCGCLVARRLQTKSRENNCDCCLNSVWFRNDDTLIGKRSPSASRPVRGLWRLSIDCNVIKLNGVRRADTPQEATRMDPRLLACHQSKEIRTALGGRSMEMKRVIKITCLWVAESIVGDIIEALLFRLRTGAIWMRNLEATYGNSLMTSRDIRNRFFIISGDSLADDRS